MENKDLIDITEYLDRFYKSFKKLWKICILIILVVIGFNVSKVFFAYKPSYSSSMTVVVTNQNKNILVTSEANENTNIAFQKALTSDMMFKIIQKDLGVEYMPASLSISIVPDTNFMIISATSSNPEDAYNVLNSVSRTYGQLTKMINDANMIILEDPYLPTNSISTPNYLRIAIDSGIKGVLYSIVLIILYAISRRTILREENIKNKLSLKTLGTIPFISTKKRTFEQEKQLLITNPRIPVAYRDAYRSLVMRLDKYKESKVLMVTSTLPNEGKSTVSSNIALKLAQKRNKVVLIDFDLRNPSLYNSFRIENTKDHIGNYLDEKCNNLEDIICSSEQSKNLDLVLGFKRYDNSIEMLSRNRTKELIETLKNKYDYVILDVPPLHIMQDALQVAKLAEAIVLVIRQDYAKVYEITEAIDELYATNRNVIGCVLNAQDKSIFDEDAKGYGYGYRYGK